MNVLLLTAEEVARGPRVALTGRRFDHLKAVLRAQVGQVISVGEIDGQLGQATVASIDAEQAVIDIRLDRDPPEPPGIALVLALPRPKILRRVLQAAASMGCKDLALVGSYRVEKSYFATPHLAPLAMRAELLLGLEQGRDTRLPRVTVHRHFKPFVEDVLEDRFSNATRLLPHPKAARGLPRVSSSGPAVLAIGPEGGWTDYEAQTLDAHGFAPFSAGPRILRVDVAVPFLVGQVALALAHRDLDG